MASDGSLKNVRRWRTNVLSSGEIGLADKLGEDGRRHLAAGQSVRFVELGLDPARELGIFDGDGSKEEAAAMASRIKTEAIDYHGTAGPAFLDRLVADVEGAKIDAKRFIEMFMSSSVPSGADGQVTRVARKFATVAAAGELAAKWCVLPAAFTSLEISDVADRLFHVWLSERGGVGCSEDRQAILRLRAFLQTHSSARMPPLLSRTSNHDGSDESDRIDLSIKSSFRVQMLCGYQDAEHFYLNDGGFKEALGGLDPASAADALFRNGYLVRAEGQRRKAYVTTPEGRQRLYRIKKSIMEFDDGI